MTLMRDVAMGTRKVRETIVTEEDYARAKEQGIDHTAIEIPEALGLDEVPDYINRLAFVMRRIENDLKNYDEQPFGYNDVKKGLEIKLEEIKERRDALFCNRIADLRLKIHELFGLLENKKIQNGEFTIWMQKSPASVSYKKEFEDNFIDSLKMLDELNFLNVKRTVKKKELKNLITGYIKTDDGWVSRETGETIRDANLIYVLENSEITESESLRIK